MNTNKEGMPGFDWSAFEEGYNKNFKVDQNCKVYSHEAYAEDEYNLLMGKSVDVPKDAEKTGTIYTITDLKPLSDHEVLATINGASDIVIDLNKETKYLSLFTSGDGEPMTPELFTQYIKLESYKNNFLANQMSVQVMATKTEKKVSIWNGHIQTLKKTG